MRKNSKRPDTMTLLMKRKSSALAHHQNRVELLGADCCRCPAAFPDFFILIQRRALAQDCSEREQVRIALEHDAAVGSEFACVDSRA